MNKYVVILSLLVLMQGCIIYKVKKNTRESFTYCWSENKTGLDSLLNLKGFFHATNVVYKDSVSKIIDFGATYYPCYVFFQNGFSARNLPLEWYLKDHKVNEPPNTYTSGSVWGLYKIYGDTIKVQYIPKPGGMSCKKIEIWFKIINKNTIQELYFKYGNSITYEEVRNYQKNKNVNDFMQFVSLDTLPDPYSSWIIKEKWFWCNEEDYEEFMRQKK